MDYADMRKSNGQALDGYLALLKMTCCVIPMERAAR